MVYYGNESPSVERPPGGRTRPEWGGLAGEMIAQRAVRVKDGRFRLERALVNVEGPLEKVDFFVNTGAIYFAEWLEQHTWRDEQKGKLKFLTEDGWIVLRCAVTPFSSTPPAIPRPFGMAMYITHVMESGELREDHRTIPSNIGILFRVVPLASERTEVTGERYHLAVKHYFRKILAEIGKRWPEARERLKDVLAELQEPLPEPAKPAKGRDLYQWFDWREAMIARGYKVTLKDIADKTGFSHGHVKNLKSEYNAERGLTKSDRRPDQI